MSTNLFPYTLEHGAQFIGIYKITEANYEEVYMRYEMMRLANDPVVQVPDGNGNLAGRKITLEEVKAHIGLEARARKLTKAEFNKTLVESLRERAEWSLKRAKENAEGGE